MGIKNLNAFINKYAPEGVTEEELTSLNINSIAIDTSIFLYKFKYSNKFIDSFIQQASHFMKSNIIPIYIFDGAPPKEKQDVLDSRKEHKMKISNNVAMLELKKEQAQTPEEKNIISKEIEKERRKCINITRDDITNLKLVFDIIGVRYIQPNCEADLVCCELYKKGLVQACLSNDMDFLPSGAGILIRNYNLSNRVLKYNLNTILTKLGMNYEEFVDFCILCGCDYTCKIPRLGNETAYKFIKDEKLNIEGILEKYVGETSVYKKFVMPNNFDYNSARFLLKNEKNKNISFNVINRDFRKKINDITINEREFIKNLTNYSMNQLMNRIKVIVK